MTDAPRRPGPRVVALVGPQGSGKTSLAEALLHGAGQIARKGTVNDGTTLGDSSDEARARQMTTAVNVARFSYLDDDWTLLDCPGSVELSHTADCAAMVADIVVVVAEPLPDRIAALQPILRRLDELAIPHLIFLNKMDQAAVRVRDLIAELQAASARPLVLRQVPIRDGERITGYVDLISERAYKYRDGEASELIELPGEVADREQEARQELLEALADFDDTLLEQLLEDIQPPREEVYQQLAKDLADDLVVPVLLGAALPDNGIQRLLKALRHDTPDGAATRARLGLEDSGPLAQVFWTDYQPHAGKMSFIRLWAGSLKAGDTLAGEKVGGLMVAHGADFTKADRVEEGEVAAINRADNLATGQVVSATAARPAELWPAAPTPVYALAVVPEKAGDDVKLSAALARLSEEDGSLLYRHDPETGELVIEGQGEMHLLIAMDRLKRKANIALATHPPAVPYKETITKSTSHHARFKRQTGGHGQFADIKVDIKPQPRGAGFAFASSVVGGAVPKQFIPAVEAGVKDYLSAGPLGFPVVDLAVTLTDGQFHSVDSSDMAFKTAGRMAMADALPECNPMLLEPIWKVRIDVPSEYTPKAQRLLSTRRGQILGFDSHPDWTGWDRVEAFLPRAEMGDLIIELRSLTQGLGTYSGAFDHLQELSGREADKVVRTKAEAAA
ncbi:MAG: elongation factor G [Azospirillaceae bacterium]